MRVARVAVLATTILAAGATPGSAQDLPSHLQEGLFEIVIPSLGPVTLPALIDTATAVLLPIEPVLEHAGYELDRGVDQRVWRAGPAAPEHRLISEPPRYLGPEGGALTLDPGSVHVHGERFFVRTAELGRLLAADVEIDWSTLRVVLRRRDPPFPALVRARIEARRRRLVGREEETSAAVVPYHPRTGGVILDWGVSASPTEERAVVQGALGTAVWGGDLLLGGSVARGTAPDELAEFSYRRIFPERSWVNQLVAGQVITQDLAPRSIIGVVVSNIPQQRDAQFAEVPILPDIPAGWEFEVYQSGRLVGFSSAGAEEGVRVPVRYGQTPLEVRMVSPAGEEIVSKYRFLVPVTHLPPGRTEYSAGGGVCPGDGCDGLGYGEVRHGLNRRLTVGGGLQAVSEAHSIHVRPSVLASYAPDRHWAFDLEARAEEFVRGTLDHIDDAGRHLGVDASIHQPEFGQPTFLPGSDARWQVQARAGLHPVHVSGRVDGVTGEGIDRVRLSLGGALPRGFGEVALEKGRFGADRLTGRATMVLPEDWWAFDRPVTVAGSFRTTRSGLRLLEISSSLRPLENGQLSTALQWDGDRDALHASLTFRLLLDGARLNTAAVRRPKNSTLLFSADGSVALDGERNVHFTDRDLQRRAGVLGRVYYDRNGDRAFDAGDEPAADVSVLVGGIRARTDARGFYRAWNVTPYEITTIAVDTLSGIDPRYTVLAGGTLLRPVPHLANRVDFPLAETRELLGRVVRPSGDGLGGVAVVVRHESGREMIVRTFSDGTFYVSRLLPGRWRVEVSEASLEAMNATADPDGVWVDIDLTRDDPLIELEPFVLH